MRHEPRLPRDDVNAPPRNPIKDGLVMLIGLIAIMGVILGATALLIDRLVPYVPRSWESRMFPDFEELAYQPESEDESAYLYQRRLEDLMARISAHWPERPDGLHVGLLDDELPNALAFPGGQVLVTTGLMKEVESENELAFILGHELGHYAGRDHLRSLGRSLTLALIMVAMRRSGAAGDLVALSGQITGRAFSREQESQADAFGLSLVVAEFGHVSGATDFFEKLPAPEGRIERSLSTYLATHPVSAERVEAMERLAIEKDWPVDGSTTALE